MEQVLQLVVTGSFPSNVDLVIWKRRRYLEGLQEIKFMLDFSYQYITSQHPLA